MTQLRLFANDFDEPYTWPNHLSGPATDNIVKIVCNDPNQFKKAHDSDAGYDIISAEGISVPSNGKALISTGLYMAIPEGYVGIIKSRSGLSVKGNLEHGAGVIDAGYRGEVKVVLRNFRNINYYINKGDKIAQMLILKLPDINIERVAYLDDTTRGENGFGSTGV